MKDEYVEKVGKASKKTTVNLFIDSGILDGLKEEANSKRVSLNSIINTILNKYVNFFRRAEEINALFIEPRQWKGFLEMLDEEKTAEIMKSDADSVIAYLKHSKIPVTKENVIKHCLQNLALWTGVCTKFRQYVDEQGYRHLVFDHLFNIKWSRIASNVFSELIRRTFNMPTDVSVLPNTFEIKLMESEI